MGGTPISSKITADQCENPMVWGTHILGHPHLAQKMGEEWIAIPGHFMPFHFVIFDE